MENRWWVFTEDNYLLCGWLSNWDSITSGRFLSSPYLISNQLTIEITEKGPVKGRKRKVFYRSSICVCAFCGTHRGLKPKRELHKTAFRSPDKTGSSLLIVTWLSINILGTRIRFELCQILSQKSFILLTALRGYYLKPQLVFMLSRTGQRRPLKRFEG